MRDTQRIEQSMIRVELRQVEAFLRTRGPIAVSEPPPARRTQ